MDRVPGNKDVAKKIGMSLVTVAKLRRNLVKLGLVAKAPVGKPKGSKSPRKAKSPKASDTLGTLIEMGVPGNLSFDGVKDYLRQSIKQLDAQRKKLESALRVLGD